MAKKQEPTITIDDKEYKASDLSDKCKTQINNLQMCEAEINRLNNQLAIAGTARMAYQKALTKELPKEGVKH